MTPKHIPDSAPRGKRCPLQAWLPPAYFAQQDGVPQHRGTYACVLGFVVTEFPAEDKNADNGGSAFRNTPFHD